MHATEFGQVPKTDLHLSSHRGVTERATFPVPMCDDAQGVLPSREAHMDMVDHLLGQPPSPAPPEGKVIPCDSKTTPPKKKITLDFLEEPKVSK